MFAGSLYLALALLVTLAGAALVWFSGKRAEARRAARFSERPLLEPAAIWRDIYHEREVSLHSVETALRLVSEATDVPVGKIRPADRFAVELAPERGWEFDDGLAEISWYVESRSKGSSADLETVDNLIRLLGRLEERGESQTAPST